MYWVKAAPHSKFQANFRHAYVTRICLHMLIANRVLAVKVVYSREAKCILKKYRPNFRLYKTSHCSPVRSGDTTASASAHQRQALKARCSVNANIDTYLGVNLRSLLGRSKRCETPTRLVNAKCIDCFGNTMNFRRWLASVGGASLHPRQTSVK